MITLPCGAPPLWTTAPPLPRFWICYHFVIKCSTQRVFPPPALPLTRCHQFIDASRSLSPCSCTFATWSEHFKTLFFFLIRAAYSSPHAACGLQEDVQGMDMGISPGGAGLADNWWKNRVSRVFPVHLWPQQHRQNNQDEPDKHRSLSRSVTDEMFSYGLKCKWWVRRNSTSAALLAHLHPGNLHVQTTNAMHIPSTCPAGWGNAESRSLVGEAAVMMEGVCTTELKAWNGDQSEGSEQEFFMVSGPEQVRENRPWAHF